MFMVYLNKVLSIVCCLTIVFGTILASDFTLAENTTETTAPSNRKATSGELDILHDFNPLLGTYYYDVYLKGSKLGRASIAVDRNGAEYVIAVKARTRGIMKHLYKVKYRGEATVTRGPLEPQSASIVERTGSKKKTIEAAFEGPDRIVAIEEEVKGDNPPKVKTKEYESESFILDPFSIVFLIRSLNWQLGSSEVFDIFTGSKQYEIHLHCKEEMIVIVDDVPRPCWVIAPETWTLTEPKKMRGSGFKIYLSQDERKEILKITGNPKIGKIVADLRKFQEREK